MKLTKRNCEFLKKLENMGVKFDVFGSYSGGGFHTLSTDGLVEYLKNPELWREEVGAEEQGVTLQQYRVWWAFASNPQCRGITSKGRQCKIEIQRVPPAGSYNPDIDPYCWHHSRLG